MKKKEIPQDVDENYMGKHKLRYARDEHGKMVPVESKGWSIETEATQCAWDDINENLQETLEKVKNNKLRPLAYHIEAKLLTPTLMAQNLGISSFILKWHLKRRPFFNPTEKTYKKYAEYLEIDVDDIKRIPDFTK